MIRLQALIVGASLLATVEAASAKDAFDAVRCDGDVAKALVGGKMGDEPVAAIEKRHAALGLKDEGGDEISDAVSYQAWSICGGSYHVLEKGGVVRDAVKADHSKAAPEFVGTCKVDGVETKGPVLAILEAGSAESLAAKSAWRIDEKNAKFVTMDAKGLTCPRSGISTIDGGR